MTNELTNAAALLGKKGGAVRSEKKTQANRKNAQKAGRPRLPEDQVTKSALYQRARRERKNER